MRLVVQSFGSTVKKKNNRIVVSSEGESSEFPISDLKQIILSEAVSITTGALILATENGVDVAIMTSDGVPCCRLLPCSVSGNVITRRNQIKFSETPASWSFISSIIRAKAMNMAGLLKTLAKRRLSEEMVKAAETIRTIAAGIRDTGDLASDAGILRAIEGEASHVYFRTLSNVLPHSVYHGKRMHRPAEDLFNAALNYGYGILYHEVERACYIAGLDPSVGILHTDRYGKMPLVYDVIEPYRQPVVDAAVISLLTRNQLVPTDLDPNMKLTVDARRKIAGSTLSRLTDEREIEGVKTTIAGHIQDGLWGLVHLINEGRPFRPYVHRWD